MQTMDDMVMVAEMEAGPLMCVPQTTDVTALVTEVVEEFQVIVGQTHSVLLSEPARVVAEVDPKLLQRLLANLIANAAKYSPTASEISVVLSVEEGGFCLSVADQGIGIPEDELPRLFDPYFRASNATGTKGTGLGLAIVKAVVELHGGTITVESVLNQGTRFSLHFPLAALGRFVFGSSVREQF
jgi:signal transduction histidine kinase